MTAPWPERTYPLAPTPALVPQQGTGMRVTRIVLAAVVVSGWSWGPVASGSAAMTGSGLDFSWDESALVSLAILVLLIIGPQPRWATKWAWFWLLGLGPMSVVFLLAEPVPVWQSSPAYLRPSRLTGGWAFLLMIFGGIVLSALTALLAVPWIAAASWLNGPGFLGLGG